MTSTEAHIGNRNLDICNDHLYDARKTPQICLILGNTLLLFGTSMFGSDNEALLSRVRRLGTWI